MKRLLKFSAVASLAVGMMYGATRQPVIDAAPEPIKTGLQRARLDIDKIAAGTGWESKKTPTGGDSGGDGIPLFKKYGVGN
jgi:hypothetical protein